MFNENRYTGNLDQIVRVEDILALCPWLWAFDQLWSEGWASQSGSIHIPDPSMLDQKFDKNDDWHSSIYVYSIDDGIRQARAVQKKERFNASFEGPSHTPNPTAEGETVAERIITLLNMPDKYLRERVQKKKLVIPQIVIATPGPVDRTTHYLIYQNPAEWQKPNLLPHILECANGFQPSWLKKQMAGVAD